MGRKYMDISKALQYYKKELIQTCNTTKNYHYGSVLSFRLDRIDALISDIVQWQEENK